MEIFENIFNELKSYRKVLQIVLYLMNQERYDDAKMMIKRLLTLEEIQEPITEVLNGDSDSEPIQTEEG